MGQSLVDLPWLPEPHDDWLQRCKQLPASTSGIGNELRALAGFRLDARKSRALGRAAALLRKTGRDLMPLSGFRLGVIAANTFDLTADCLPAAAIRHGVSIEVVQTPYGMIAQSILDPGSTIYSSHLDAVAIIADYRWYGFDAHVENLDEERSVDAALHQIDGLLSALSSYGGPPAIVETLAVPLSNLFGSFDTAVAGTVRARVALFNQKLVPLVRKYQGYLLDVASLAAQVGGDQWFDPVHWAAYKLPFNSSATPIYAEWFGRLLGAIRGKSAKCLVLDLDNTCWGGVIGDDGMGGIVIGQGDARGEAHLAVQRVALDLRARGIFLAVSSKNDQAIALEPFRTHQDMLLREEHISVFRANWVDKATNLEAIAETLNIGLDALVLLDDNPAERAQVRGALPMVRVPEVPDDPAWFAWTLEAGGWFEAVTYTAEDSARTVMQSQDAHRAQVQMDTRDLGEYLLALEMEIRFDPFDPQGRKRIAQLINKTNQFNLTTRRYAEAEVSGLEADRSILTLQIRLSDRFGELGMIGVVICRPDGDDPTALGIDTWLMSCRVLGRQVEVATLAAIVGKAKTMHVERLIGTYIPTDKNRLVEDHYRRLGFVQAASDPQGRTVWVLDFAHYEPPVLPMKVVH